MTLPVGYTQLPSGAWTKDSDGTGPYAWSGIAMYLMASGAIGTGTIADYNQHPSGYWFKTDTTGPYAKGAGGVFYLASAGGGPVDFTNITADNLDIRALGKIELFNTSPISEVNYEKLVLDWSSNVARLWTQNDGTGSPRTLRVGASHTDGTSGPSCHTTYAASTLPGIEHTRTILQSTAGVFHELASFTPNSSSGAQTAVAVSPNFAQTGTAAGIALLVNPSGTFGSGGGLLQSWQMASGAVAQLSSDGIFYSVNVRTQGLVLGASFNTGDTVLLRDGAADTLALRRTTNAQTFRVYNTYTDASNYERLDTTWYANVANILTQQAGTGAARALTIGTAGSANFNIMTNGSRRWNVLSTTGHLVAEVDNTYDIGAAGATRPRNVYIATGLTVGGGSGFGAAASSTTFAALGASTTALSSLRLGSGVAPTAPVDGDIWFTGTLLQIRVGGVTRTVTLV